MPPPRRRTVSFHPSIPNPLTLIPNTEILLRTSHTWIPVQVFDLITQHLQPGASSEHHQPPYTTLLTTLRLHTDHPVTASLISEIHEGITSKTLRASTISTDPKHELWAAFDAMHDKWIALQRQRVRDAEEGEEEEEDEEEGVERMTEDEEALYLAKEADRLIAEAKKAQQGEGCDEEKEEEDLPLAISGLPANSGWVGRLVPGHVRKLMNEKALEEAQERARVNEVQAVEEWEGVRILGLGSEEGEWDEDENENEIENENEMGGVRIGVGRGVGKRKARCSSALMGRAGKKGRLR